MAITVKYLESLGIDNETAQKIFAERGKEVEAEKAQVNDLKSQLEEKTKGLETLTAEMETLKANNASAAEIQKEFYEFKAEVSEKEAKAEQERIAKEKATNIGERFKRAVGDKKFAHEAIRDSYLAKFTESLDSEENAGRSDEDILHELVKNDANAFVGVTPVILAGAKEQTPAGGKVYNSREEIMAIKDTSERQAAIAQNIELFK